MQPAFAATPLVLSRSTATPSTTSFVSRPQFAAAAVRAPKRAAIATPSMALKQRNNITKKIETQKLGLDLPGRQIPQGFTPYSEKLNGRVTMISFVAALAAEVLNPAHPTIVQQVGAVMEPVNHLLQGLL